MTNLTALDLAPLNRRDAQLPDYHNNTLYRFLNTSHVIKQLQPDYPVHCFCPDQLNKRAELFIDNFPGKVGFAVKANGETVVLDQLAKSGIHFFDAASISEVALVRQVDANAKILYDNPVKSKEEIEKAYFHYGVRSFALDDEIELTKIQSIIGKDPGVQLTVRFKIKGSYAAQDLNTKFGANVEEAGTLLQLIKQAGYKPALTFHPGSQCYTPSAYKDYIYAAAMIAEKAKVKIVMLNVGGGFPAAYLDTSIPPLSEFFEAIDSQFKLWFSNSDCELVCEPGRSMVASSSTLLCRVKHRRNENVLFLNDGIYGGFMEQFITFFKLPTKVYRDSQILLDTLDEFKIYGPTCDSTDCFTESILLPASIKTDDWIEFGLTGAYGSATTTRFNGYSSESYVIVEKASRFPD